MFPWLDPHIEKIASSLRNGTAAHALMLSGGQGVGGDFLARELASMALCQSSRSSSACGQCKSCKLFECNSHSDFRWLRPEDTGKQIKVDDVRSLVEFVHGSSHQGGRKVVIIDPIEALNVNGANALLKTLEEPAGDTLLILVAERDESVLPTIRSRCQVIQVRPPVWDDALVWLRQQKADRPESELQNYLRLASGEPITALKYMELGALAEQDRMLLALASVLKNESTVSSVAGQWADELIMLRLEWMAHWVEQILRCSALGSDEPILHPNAIKMFSYFANKIDAETLHTLRREILMQLASLGGVSNPNPQLALEAVLLQWHNLMQAAKKSP